MKTYNQFLESKTKAANKSGFTPDKLNEHLFPFQAHIVTKACEAGKYAIFADCGMGKTIMQLAWSEAVANHTGGKILILAPLAVTGQTIEEGRKFGIEVSGVNENASIHIANYEQLKNIDASLYVGIVLDESSKLKNFTGKMRNLIIDEFLDTPYKLPCTATPSPNDPMELGNHSQFLDVMTRNSMLSMYFVHDGGQTSKWRLKKHAMDSFFGWVSSWATMIASPSDIGFSDDGYVLPELKIIDHQIKTPKKPNGQLFNDVAVSATNFNQALRDTRKERMEAAAVIANETKGPVIVWIKHNDEGKMLRSLIHGAIEVAGSDKSHIKEKRLLGFGKGEFRVLITKAKIAQFGLNYQNCACQIFASLDFSFEGTYQAIRRSWRFGQLNEVNIHIITTDTMQNVRNIFDAKQKEFYKMQVSMAKAISFKITNTIPMVQEHIKEESYELMRGDCCKRIKEIESESIGLSIFSPPFADLYTYSNHPEDMGNSTSYDEFLQHFDYLVEDLFRVMKSGRNVLVHCMDLPIQKGKEGFIGLRDFSGHILAAFKKAGFIYHSRVTIWKNPVVEMQRTKALGLLHKQLKKDSTMSRVGIPDYLLVFRKDGERLDPVHTNIPVDLWQKWASPVWMDIDYGNTLQYRSARDAKDEKHICPLQLDTIERGIGMYSNEGDTVFSPFAGIGSEGYQALKMGRKFVGIELKESYFSQATKNLKAASQLNQQQTLF